MAGTTKTYELGETEGQAWIKCLDCNLTSYNPGDVASRYCGHCHRFHAQGLVPSVAIQRLLEEVRGAPVPGRDVVNYYDRRHDRHNRS